MTNPKSKEVEVLGTERRRRWSAEVMLGTMSCCFPRPSRLVARSRCVVAKGSAGFYDITIVRRRDTS